MGGIVGAPVEGAGVGGFHKTLSKDPTSFSEHDEILTLWRMTWEIKFIISTKEKQNSAFLDIMKHLEKIKKVELSTQEHLNSALRHKDEIVKQKDKLKKEIDEIIEAEN